MSFELDDIYFLENYETLLIVKNHIYLSNKKYFSLEHFRNEKYSDKNLIEIRIEEILAINFNDLSEQVKIETRSKSFHLIFFDSKMLFRFISRIEPSLVLEKTEENLTRAQKIIPLLFIFVIIVIICLFFGIENSFILLIGLLFAIHQVYKMYRNSKNVVYSKSK